MTWQLRINPRAEREMRDLPDNLLRRIDARIRSLVENPWPRGTRKLTNVALYRLRVGQYRVLYSVDETGGVVEIVAVRHRREAYR